MIPTKRARPNWSEQGGSSKATSASPSAAVSQYVGGFESVLELVGAMPPSLLHVPLWHGCRSIEDFDPVAKISEGSYGEVFAARDRHTGEIVALKRMKFLRQSAEEGFPLYALREIQALVAVHHENLLRAREVLLGEPVDLPAESSSGTSAEEMRRSAVHLAQPGSAMGAHYDVYMSMDFCPTDLSAALAAERPGSPPAFTHAQAKELVRQMLLGLNDLHSRGFMHRDLKPQNVLLAPDGRPVLCDFGMTRRTIGPPGLVPYTAGKQVVTRWYRSPELLLGAVKYGPASDVWSLGCIFTEILTGRPMAAGRTDTEQANLVLALRGLPQGDEWPEWRSLPGVRTLRLDRYYPPVPLRQAVGLPARAVSGDRFLSDLGMDLLGRMLELNPAVRVTAAQALRHPWFLEAPRPCGTYGLPPREMPAFPPPATAPTIQGPASIARLARERKVVDTQERAKSMARGPSSGGEPGSTARAGAGAGAGESTGGTGAAASDDDKWVHEQTEPAHSGGAVHGGAVPGGTGGVELPGWAAGHEAEVKAACSPRVVGALAERVFGVLR